MSTKYNSLGFIISCWLFFFPGSWLLTSALFISLFSQADVITDIDISLVIIAFICLFMRRIIVSVKYGYFSPEIYHKLSKPAPEWDGDKTRRQLVTWGWSKPRDYPGLLEDELTISMNNNDVSLRDISFTLNLSTAEFFQKKENNSRFAATTEFTEKNQVSAAFLLTEILKSVYEKNPLLKSNESSMNIMTFSFALILPAIALYFSYSYGLEFFGSSVASKFVGVGTLIGLFLCHQLLLFGLLCRFDYNRRSSALKILGDLIQYPGVKKSHIYPDDLGLIEMKENIFIDLENRSNVFSWTVTRRVLKTFGEAFYERIQGYTSILFLFSLICVGILNLLFWGAFEHHISTIIVLICIICSIAFVSLRAISSAIKLQNLSEMHKDRLRRIIFMLEEQSANSNSETNIANKENSSSVRALLQQADESLGYYELVYKPVMLLGYPASRRLIGSFLGIFFTGLVLALEGFSGSGISYDTHGWFLR